MEVFKKLSTKQARKMLKDFNHIMIDFRFEKNLSDLNVRIAYRDRILNLLKSYGIDREHADVKGLNKALDIAESEVLDE